MVGGENLSKLGVNSKTRRGVPLKNGNNLWGYRGLMLCGEFAVAMIFLFLSNLLMI
ncbi:hypothetical protein BDZ91DRAFT_717660 [Kalaharituber pfeilii]|nr:hypothetical protein BDZ91DRAFT_717660 [Kalaharituber pfeilii]